MKSEWWMMVLWVWITQKVLGGLGESLTRRSKANKG